MSSVVIKETEAKPEAEPVDMKLEVVLLGVSDVDRAKAFYENLGWRLDIDVAGGDFRGVQVTPHNSEASIIFGKGVTSAEVWLGAQPGPRRGRHRRRPQRLDRPRRRRERGLPLRRRPLQQHRGEPTRQRARPGRSFLLLVCLVRGSGRERLAAPGDHDAASRPRVEVAASTEPRTSKHLQNSSTRRQSTTTGSRRRTPSTTGGTGTRPT